MSSADSNNIGIKLQAAGENLNTWGDPNLNNDLIVLSNLASKFNAVTINGDTTVSETNYSTTNTTEVALLKWNAGTLTAAFSYTIPSRPKRFILWNNTGYTGTIKLAATTGVAIPTGRIALISTDGSSDVYNVTPNYGGITSPTTGSRDIPAWSAVENAIATAVLPATAGTILISGTDTTAGYGSAKFTALTNGGLVASVLNPTGNAQRQFGLDYTNLLATTNIASTDRFALYDATAGAMKYQTRANVIGKFGLVLQPDQTAGFTATVGSLWPCDTTSASYTVVWPAAPTAGDIFGLAKFGTGLLTHSLNSVKFYGSTTPPQATLGEGIGFFYYTGASRGWIDL